MRKPHEYNDDAAHEHMIIKRTFTVSVGNSILAWEGGCPKGIPGACEVKAKIVFYHGIKMHGVLHPRDKKVYQN